MHRIIMKVEKGWIPIVAHPKSKPTLHLNSPEMLFTKKMGKKT